MQFTLFGVIWILLLTFFFFVMDVHYIVAMALFSMVLQCNNVMQLGSTGVGVQVFTALIVLFRFALLPTKYQSMSKMDRSFYTAPLLLVMYLLICSLLIHKQFSKNWVKVTIIAVYALLFFFLYCKQLPASINEQWLEKTIDSIVVIVITIGFIQYFACAGESFLRPILSTFVFNDVSNKNVIFHAKPSYLAMYSTFMEPSYFAAFMVGCFSIISMRDDVSGKNLVLLLMIGVSILLSRSSTGFGGLAIVLAIQTIRFFGKKNIVRVIVPIAIIAVFLLVFLKYDLLDRVLFSKNESSSYIVRARWNQRAWGQFLGNPIFGVGLGYSRASSLFYTILAELGILGLIFYFKIILQNIRFLFSNIESYLVTGAAFSILAISICQLIACPDLNFSPFWMMMFIMAISCNLYSDAIDIG